MAENRIAREVDTRAEAERPKSWQPASTLPEPDKLDWDTYTVGYVYLHWVKMTPATPHRLFVKAGNQYVLRNNLSSKI
jgi:hypothetical protein